MNFAKKMGDKKRDDSNTTNSADFSLTGRFLYEQIIDLESSDDENASRDNTIAEPSPSSFNVLANEEVIILDSSDDDDVIRLNPVISIDSSDGENTSNDCTTAPSSSLHSINALRDDQEVTIDENARRDGIAIESSTSADASGNYDNLSPEESSFDLKKEFPFECARCGNLFSEAHELFFHYDSRHEKPYTCKNCNRPFTCDSGFIHHIQRHTEIGGIPFNCSICNYGYTRELYLRQHMMINHRIENPE